MTSSSKPPNLFQTLFLVVAITFALTACAYGVMAVHRIDPTGGSESTTGTHWLLGILDRYGGMLLLFELAILATTALAAVATDSRRKRRKGTADNRE
jgi:hypothetical protein